MPVADIKPFTKTGVTCIAFNADKSLIAICPNSNKVLIYETNGSVHSTKWNKEPKYVLEEHTETVVGMDWCPSTNLLGTCANDRNAYVWKHVTEKKVIKGGNVSYQKEDKWKADLVILRINRAATAVKWSPSGAKFAVTSGAKVVPICYYVEEHKWWTCNTIKKHKSTVLDVAWCPNSKFVVTGATDYKCRIISAFKAELDSSEDDGFGAIFPKQHQFGEVLAEFTHAKAWVQSVAWSPSSYRLAFTGHGSTIHLVQIVADGPPVVTTIRASGLPYIAVEFLSDKAVVAAGYDQNPHLYVASDASGAEPEWKFEGNIDKEVKKKKRALGSFSGARAMFEAKSLRGQASNVSNKKNTVHQNLISGVLPLENATMMTYGLDGIVAFWNMKNQGFDDKSLMAKD